MNFIAIDRAPGAADAADLEIADIFEDGAPARNARGEAIEDGSPVEDLEDPNHDPGFFDQDDCAEPAVQQPAVVTAPSCFTPDISTDPKLLRSYWDINGTYVLVWGLRGGVEASAAGRPQKVLPPPGTPLCYVTQHQSALPPPGAYCLHGWEWSDIGGMNLCWVVDAELHASVVRVQEMTAAFHAARVHAAINSAAAAATAAAAELPPMIHYGEHRLEDAQEVLSGIVMSEQWHGAVARLTALLQSTENPKLCIHCEGGNNTAVRHDADGKEARNDDGQVVLDLQLCGSCAKRCGQAAGCRGIGGKKAPDCLGEVWVHPCGCVQPCCNRCEKLNGRAAQRAREQREPCAVCARGTAAATGGYGAGGDNGGSSGRGAVLGDYMTTSAPRRRRGNRAGRRVQEQRRRAATATLAAISAPAAVAPAVVAYGSRRWGDGDD